MHSRAHSEWAGRQAPQSVLFDDRSRPDAQTPSPAGRSPSQCAGGHGPVVSSPDESLRGSPQATLTDARPLLHFNPSRHLKHVVEPPMREYVSPAHCTHATELAGANVPPSHRSQTEPPGVARKWPARHGVHESEPRSDAKDPSGQGEHCVDAFPAT